MYEERNDSIVCLAWTRLETYVWWHLGGSLCCIGGARAQQIRRLPSGDLDICRLLRLQSQAGVELEELGRSQPGTRFHRCMLTLGQIEKFSSGHGHMMTHVCHVAYQSMHLDETSTKVPY